MADLLDRYASKPAAQQGGGGGDLLDRYASKPAAQDPGREASLGERFMTNADVGFEGTLAGQAVENARNPANLQQAQANTIAEVLARMSETGAANAPAVMPNPAQGGTPSPEGADYLGAGVETTMPGRGTGDLAGQSEQALAAQYFQHMQAAEEGQREYDEARAPVLARREGMPSWYEEEGLGGKGAAGIAALLGQLTGGAPSPENLVAFGRGANVLGRAGRGAAGGAAGAGVAEPVVQEQEVRRGEREDTSLGEGALNVALGGLLGGALNVTPDAVRGIRQLIAGRKGKPEADVTADDLQDFDPAELMRVAQEASDAATLDPEALDTAIRTGTGQDANPRVGEGMAPQDARRARRDVERELGQAFESTDVLRREDVQPGEEGLEVREGAEPLRDPTGEQANPETYGARSTAARTARDLGVTLDENGIRLAARDIQADPQADPAAIVRSYSREDRGRAFDRADVQRRRGDEYQRDREGRIEDFQAQPEQVQARIRQEYANRGIDPDSVENAFNRAARQDDMRDVPDLREEQASRSREEFSRPAFELAERRRQRREEDLATGENVDRQASTYRAAEEPYERQGQREVTLLGARRDRRGQLVGGEAVEVLARSQRQTPQGEVQDMVRIVRGDNDPEWVPADQLETVTTPENPRMFGEALSQTQEPPRGVMTGRGDSPEGFDASQTPEPRRAVDRQSDPDGLRRGLYSEGEVETGPQGDGPAPRTEETIDGNTGRPYREAETSEVSPQGEVRTEFQGEGGEMPITRTRRPVNETGPRPLDPETQRWVREGEPDPRDDFETMSDADAEAFFNPSSRGTQTAQPRDNQAQPDAPEPQAVNANAPESLSDPEAAQALRDSKTEYGWAERGGNLIRDAQGNAVGRTRWLPTNEALMDALKNKKVTKDGYQKLVDRALDPEARPLTNRQRNILEDVLEAIDSRARERAEAEAEAEMDEAFGRPDQADDFDLEGQTEASRAAEEQQTREREDTARRQRLNEEQRAQADRDADDFTLTGSDRPADEAAARGQMDLTDQPANPRAEEPASEANLDEAKALLASRREAAGNKKAEAALRKKVRDLAARTPASDERTVMVLDTLATRLDMNEQNGRYKDIEFAPAQSRPKKTQGGTDSPGGTQLYSGIPLDRITAAVKRAWAGERKGARETAERTGMLMESTKEALGGSRAKNRSTKRSPLMDLWRVTLASLDGDLRTLAGKFKSPTLKSLPDMFHATAGRGDAVGQTFDEAVQARNNPRLQEVDRFMSRLRDAGLSSTEKQAQVIRLVENPKAARRGEAGKVANDIEKFLKAELDYLRKAGVDVGEVRDGYFPREMDGGKARANADGFIRAATRAYKEMGLRDADAKASAEAYWESTVYGASGKPGAKRNPGQTPSFVQSRVFTKAAAKHLEAYRVRDIDSVLSQYVMRATRRAEIARRFGDNWKDWDDIEAKIRQEDPDAQEILPLVRDRVAMSAGVNLHSLGSAAQHSLSMARTWTTLATLPKAAMSSIGELVIAPWRGATGNVPGDMGQHLVNIWAHTANFSRTLSGLGRNEQLQASFELAEDIGIIAGTGHNSLMAARFAGGDPVGRVQSEVLAQFFRRNLLEGLTNYTRVTSMVQGQVFLRRLGKQMERHPNRTGVFLRELGVPKGEEAAFAKYVRDMGDDMPMSSTVTGPYAGVYRNALQRFTDQTVMRPSQSTRPKYASHPLGAVIFQLQAFGYAFQKNVLNRQARLLASKDLTMADKLAYSLSAASSAALLVGLQGLMRDTRDRLYDPDIRERKTPMAHLEGAVSQAGLLGVADPYLQSLTGIRYQRNPLASLMGPAASGLAESTFTASSLLLNNSENTNTSERNLADSMYDWLIEPAAQAALTPISTGTPVLGKLATAATVYGIPKGRDYFTDAVAGPRGDRRKAPIQGTVEWIMDGPPGASEGGRSSGRSGGREAGRSGGREGGR